MRCAESLRTQAYFDGELDAVSAAQIELHAGHCAECRALLDDLKQVRAALRSDATYERAPAQLRVRVMQALEQQAEAAPLRSQRPILRRSSSFWAGAFSGSALAAALAFFFLAPSFSNPMLNDLVSAHLRSLMPSHLIDWSRPTSTP